jgi:endonuclease/exonuclease/phosphatase family metal-dependent hydrolase
VDVRGEQGGRARFGNLMLSALPVLQVFRHALPFPADPVVPGMPRCCLELVLENAGGPLRVLTTHLEYYSGVQRSAQVSALRALQAEAETHAAGAPCDKDPNPVFAARPRPAAAVLCGDFNMEPGSDSYVRMAAPAAPWLDAWPLVHGARGHAPTVGLQGADWPDRAYCCDYFWVSAQLAGRVRRLEVDAGTAASDHQPVVLDLA